MSHVLYFCLFVSFCFVFACLLVSLFLFLFIFSMCSFTLIYVNLIRSSRKDFPFPFEALPLTLAV